MIFRRMSLRSLTTLVATLAIVAASTSSVHAATDPQETYQTLIAEQLNSTLPGVQAETMQRPSGSGELGDAAGTISSVLNGLSTAGKIYSACKEPNNPFPECAIFGSNTLDKVQAELTALTNTLNAFISEYQADFAALQTELGQISAKVDNDTKQVIQALITGPLQAANAAGTINGALAACQATYVAKKSDPCTIYDSAGGSPTTAPANQDTLNSMQDNLQAALGINPAASTYADRVGNTTMKTPQEFATLLAGSSTNPYQCGNGLASCGVLGLYFSKLVTDEKTALGQPSKLAIFRPGFVNTMSNLAINVQSILGNYLIVRAAAISRLPQTAETANFMSTINDVGNSTTPADAQRFGLGPASVVSTYSLPKYDPKNPVQSYQAFLAGDTLQGQLIHGGKVPLFSPDSTAEGDATALPSSDFLKNFRSDLVAAGQKYSALPAATTIGDGPLSVFYSANNGIQDTMPDGATGRFWTAAETFYYNDVHAWWQEDVDNSEWSRWALDYFWSLRRNWPGYNNQDNSGWTDPEWYSKDASLNGLPVAHSGMVNFYETPQTMTNQVSKFQLCDSAVDGKKYGTCTWESPQSVSGTALDVYDVWLASSCQLYHGSDEVMNCWWSRQAVGVGESYQIENMQGPQNPAQSLKFASWPIGGLLQQPKNQ